MSVDLKKITYVEDEPDIREIAKIALAEIGGFEIDLCESTREATMSGHVGLAELIAHHCETLRANADLLTGLVARMSDPENQSGQPARDALHLAHQIAGAGGTIGFAEVSVLASDIEHALEPIVAVNGAPSPAQKEKIDALLSDLHKVATELRPEMSTLYGVNVAAVVEARRSA